MMREKTRILIAEDDEPSRIFLQRVLEKAGYEVRAAEDGVAALGMFEGEDIRVVITDWVMPRMGGVELCKAIRGRATEGYVFIIMVTAKDNKRDIVEAIDAGADDYVTKPYDKGELLARIRAGARIIALEQELNEKNRELLRANTTLKNDLIAASRLQTSFLPKSAPQMSGLDFSWFFRPCDMVGGDTFNFFALDDEHAALYILDVSGHGVPAAMLSVTLTRTMTPDAERGGILTGMSGSSGKGQPTAPREIARILNRRFPMDEDVGQYFTLLYGIVHLPSMRMRYVQAGHPHLMILRGNGQIQFFQRPGFAIGMFDDADFQEEEIPLGAGDRIFFYSDGIVEAVNRQDEVYGLERLVESVTDRRDRSISEITEGILDDVMRFTEGAEVLDDMTLVAFLVNQ
jgi:sigma-B regulation protein RsbU (phosphoserine phosphatase)